jgi:hypothetical protein
LALSAFYVFNTAGAYVVCRSVADALFLARVGTAWLPLMYLLSASVVGMLCLAFSRLASHVPLKRMIGVTLFLLAASSLVLCLAIERFDHALLLLAAIYLLAEFRGCINSIQHGILVNEVFADSSAFHRANGLLGAAATFAGITFGAFIALEVYVLGTVHLLYVVAALEVVALLAIAGLHNVKHAPVQDLRVEAEAALSVARFDGVSAAFSSQGLRAAVASPYIRGIALLVGLTVVVATIVEFQWKFSVAQSYETRETEMVVFFGWFHAGVGLCTAVIQIVLTGRLLHRFDPRTLLLVYPVTLFAATVGTILASLERTVLWAVTSAKGCDVLKRSLNSPVVLKLYSHLDHGPRRHAITLVTGIVKPAAEACAAVLILVLSRFLDLRGLAFLVLGALCLWLLVVARREASSESIRPSPLRS